MMTRLADKSITQLIQEGSGKLAAMPAGGGASAGGAAAAAPEAAAKEPEKKKEEEPEEADVDMCGMFGDDDDY